MIEDTNFLRSIHGKDYDSTQAMKIGQELLMRQVNQFLGLLVNTMIKDLIELDYGLK